MLVKVIYKKIVRTNSNYQVDKLVLYDGQMIGNSGHNYQQILDQFMKLKANYNQLRIDQIPGFIKDNQDLKQS